MVGSLEYSVQGRIEQQALHSSKYGAELCFFLSDADPSIDPGVTALGFGSGTFGFRTSHSAMHSL